MAAGKKGWVIVQEGSDNGCRKRKDRTVVQEEGARTRLPLCCAVLHPQVKRGAWVGGTRPQENPQVGVFPWGSGPPLYPPLKKIDLNFCAASVASGASFG